jgi:hypothetical protein
MWRLRHGFDSTKLPHFLVSACWGARAALARSCRVVRHVLLQICNVSREMGTPGKKHGRAPRAMPRESRRSRVSVEGSSVELIVPSVLRQMGQRTANREATCLS